MARDERVALLTVQQTRRKTKEERMEYLIGVGLALIVCAFAALTAFDRDRVFYPTLLIVNATYYVLFAVMGSSMRALTIESVLTLAFVIVGVAGFKKNLWFVAAGLAGHGVFDFFHHVIIHNPGLPIWWPGFCMSFDIAAVVVFAFLLMRRRSSFALRIKAAGGHA